MGWEGEGGDDVIRQAGRLLLLSLLFLFPKDLACLPNPTRSHEVMCSTEEDPEIC